MKGDFACFGLPAKVELFMSSIGCSGLIPMSSLGEVIQVAEVAFAMAFLVSGMKSASRAVVDRQESLLGGDWIKVVEYGSPI